MADTVCPGNTALLSASLVGNVPPGITIIWYDSLVGGNIIGTGASFTTPALYATTNYYVGFCPGSFRTLVVAVVNNPTADAGTNAQICSGGSVTLNASGGVSYQWSPSNGLSNTNISNPVASPTITTTYYVTSTNLFGCTAVDSVLISLGSAAANAGNDTSICPGGNVQLQASGGVTYSWSPTTSLSNANIFNPVASPSITTSYIVTVSDGSVCSNVDTVIVTVLPSVNANAGTDDTICPGNSIQLNASGGTVYNWSPATDLDDANIYNPLSTPFGTITYTVSVSDANGCSATDDVTINVTQSVSAGFSFNSVCLSDSLMFADTSSSTNGNVNSWNWTFGDGSPNSTLQNPNHLYTAVGTYDVMLVVTNSAGCTDSLMQTITVSDSPLATFLMSDTAGCAPLIINFSDITSVSHTSIWNFDDSISGTYNSSTIQNPTHIFTQPGIYYVMLTVASTSGSCADSIIHTINVYPKPEAQFTPSPNPVAVNSVVTMMNITTDASLWNWDFGNGQTSIFENPTTTYNSSGSYHILLTAANSYGCSDTTSVVIQVEEEINLYFPNVFTPNSDRLNDVFVITNIEKLPSNHIYIYNRWGNLIYDTENYKNNWSGGDFEDGVYYFILFYPENKEIHGAITILR